MLLRLQLTACKCTHSIRPHRGRDVPLRCLLVSRGISDSEDLIAKSLTSANFVFLIVDLTSQLLYVSQHFMWHYPRCSNSDKCNLVCLSLRHSSFSNCITIQRLVRLFTESQSLTTLHNPVYSHIRHCNHTDATRV